MNEDRRLRPVALNDALPHAWLRPWVMGIAAIMLACVVTACTQPAPVVTDVAPLDYSYLTRLRLNVATIDIDDSWRAPPDGRQIGAYAPISPVAALHQMALDRLGAGGGSGRAVFTILDASLLRSRGRIDGNFAVRLSVNNAEGTRSAYAEARVARSSTLVDDDPATLRAALATLVKQAMDDMNVEFEYQIRRSLRDWLQTPSATAPLPPPVQSQDLPPPGAVTASPPYPSTDSRPTVLPAPTSPPPQMLMPPLTGYPASPTYAAPQPYAAPPADASPPAYASPSPGASFAPTPLAPPTYAAPPAYASPPGYSVAPPAYSVPQRPAPDADDDAE